MALRMGGDNERGDCAQQGLSTSRFENKRTRGGFTLPAPLSRIRDPKPAGVEGGHGNAATPPGVPIVEPWSEGAIVIYSPVFPL